MGERRKTIQELIEDFVFLDCRLGEHPEVAAVVSYKDRESIVPVAATGRRRHEVISRVFPREASVAGLVIERKKVFSFADVPKEASPFYDVSGRSARALLAVPVLDPYEAFGALTLISITPNDLRGQVGRAQVLAALIAYHEVHLGQRMRRSTPMSVTLGEALSRIRLELGLTQAQVASQVGTSRISISRWEAGGQPPAPGPLYRWCMVLGLLSGGRPTIVVPIDLTPRLIDFLKEDPTRLAQLSPEQFENFVANRLDRIGFDVTLTGSTFSRDGGIDLIAVPKMSGPASFLLAAQIKHHSQGKFVGRPDVDRLLAWKNSAFNLGLLVTNTSFTRDALWLASQDPNKAFLRLRGFHDLKRWISDNFWSPEEWREIPEEITLAPGISIKIPKAKLATSLEIWPMEVLRGSQGEDV